MRDTKPATVTFQELPKDTPKRCQTDYCESGDNDKACFKWRWSGGEGTQDGRWLHACAKCHVDLLDATLADARLEAGESVEAVYGPFPKYATAEAARKALVDAIFHT